MSPTPHGAVVGSAVVGSAVVGGDGVRCAGVLEPILEVRVPLDGPVL